MNNRELQVELWNGKIPIRFTMNPSEIAMNSFVEPHFVLASRYGYLAEVAKETTEYFQSRAIEMTPYIWFEVNGQEIPHYLPIGILFDLYSSAQRLQKALTIEEFEPWTITIRFQKPLKPSINVIPLEDIQRVYFHSLKQALHQITGTCASFNLLTINHQNRLWQAINSSDFQEYSNISQIIYPPITAFETENYSAEGSEIKQLPFRLIDHNYSMRQKLVKPRSKDSSTASPKGRMVLEVLIEDFQLSVEALTAAQIIVQGIDFDINRLNRIPIQDFYFVMRHADFYLYVLLLLK